MLTRHKSVVALMAWRVAITADPVTETDFVYGLGRICVITHMELWIGITVACVPTLPPLLTRYLGPSAWPSAFRITGWTQKSRGKGPGQEGFNNSGSSGSRGFNKKSFNKLDQKSLLELEEGTSFDRSDPLAKSDYVVGQQDGNWTPAANAINVRHDVHIYGEPRSPQKV